MDEPARTARRHAKAKAKDKRTPGQVDRDRILYSSAFRRLAGVTQVVAPFEGQIFHNRLTHSVKVAQVAERLAQILLGRESREWITDWGGLDADVAAAAGLAHDLGHPPFGHIAEKELDRLARRYTPDGFEGNAQTFRILTWSCAHGEGYRGLDLTRATLNAVMKYPRFRGRKKGTQEFKKFSAYRRDSADFGWARRDLEGRTLEAAVMDYADDITYSVHDFEDFFRAGLIPLYELPPTGPALNSFLDTWIEEEPQRREDIKEHEDVLAGLLTVLHRGLGVRYEGTFEARRLLRSVTSAMIQKYLFAARVGRPGREKPLEVDPAIEIQIDFLHRLVRKYVIENPRLTTQQAGQRQIVRSLFFCYFRASQRGHADILPEGFRAEYDRLQAKDLPKRDARAASARLACDIVSSFSDDEAMMMFRRIYGVAPGSVTDILPT